MYWSIDDQNNTYDHVNIKIDYLRIVYDSRMIVQKLIYCRFYYFVDRYNGSSVIQWLIKNQYFVWQRLNISSIVEVYQLLVTWKAVYRLLLSMWADFSRWARKVGLWKVSKKTKNWNLSTKLNVCRKYQGKMWYLNLKLGWKIEIN